MAARSRIHRRAPKTRARRIHRRGRADVVQIGIGRRPLGDLYHSFLETSWPAAIAMLFGAFLGVNTFFALAYLACGDCIENARPGSFLDAFFFSVQTLATIGYGHLVPRGVLANVMVSAEAMTGLLGVAMVTGLAFTKFTRPTARVVFSKVAIIAPRNGQPCLMFRMGNERVNRIAEAQVHVTVLRGETTLEGETTRRFYDLPLERERTAAFAISWTAIHPITEHSPLYGLDERSILAADLELVVSLTGLDETFVQTVHARYSYNTDDIVWNARFADIISFLPDGTMQIDYTRFHEVVPLGDRAMMHRHTS